MVHVDHGRTGLEVPEAREEGLPVLHPGLGEGRAAAAEELALGDGEPPLAGEEDALLGGNEGRVEPGGEIAARRRLAQDPGPVCQGHLREAVQGSLALEEGDAAVPLRHPVSDIGQEFVGLSGEDGRALARGAGAVVRAHAQGARVRRHRLQHLGAEEEVSGGQEFGTPVPPVALGPLLDSAPGLLQAALGLEHGPGGVSQKIREGTEELPVLADLRVEGGVGPDLSEALQTDLPELALPGQEGPETLLEPLVAHGLGEGRHEDGATDGAEGVLGGGVEEAQGFHLVPEHLEAHGEGFRGGEHVQDAAPEGRLPGLAHHVGLPVPQPPEGRAEGAPVQRSAPPPAGRAAPTTSPSGGPSRGRIRRSPAGPHGGREQAAASASARSRRMPGWFGRPS